MVKSDSVTLVLVYLKVVCFCSFTGSEALAGFSQSPFGTNMVPAVPVISGVRKQKYLQSPCKVLPVVKDIVLSL